MVLLRLFCQLWLILLFGGIASCGTVPEHFFDAPEKFDEPENREIAEVENYYRLAVNDKIRIQVYGEPELSVETQVNEMGAIAYPFLGEVKITGLTMAEVEQLLVSRLEDGYLINPKVMVTILEYRRFFITGEVKAPGGYPYVPGLTIQKAISLAGGFTEYAAPNKIYREREGENQPVRVDLKTPVNPGDLIKVEESFF